MEPPHRERLESTAGEAASIGARVCIAGEKKIRIDMVAVIRRDP